MPHRILVIKLGALGDFVQAMGPFAAIRRHHPQAHVTLLTSKPYAALAEASPYFDDVWTDTRPKPWQLGRLLNLRAKLRRGRFDIVYDLQTSDRSAFYFRLAGRPNWSGIARGCSHPHANPRRDDMHTIERQAEQLAMAGIAGTPLPDLSWANADPGPLGLPQRYAVLVPGGAAHRPAKRWPAENYGTLAGILAASGLNPVLLGTQAEAREIGIVQAACPQALSLMGRTSFLDIAALGRNAALAVGNDTGPMHLLAAAGAPCLILFSAESDPALCAPRGRVTVLRRPDLAQLPLGDVAQATEHLVAALT
ncbi:MAG: glycosyltransferase family 9 protein [Rhodospirillales bacterium]|nr:glycosyltransferase family 9 protein [Rhodospirillales bacterium]